MALHYTKEGHVAIFTIDRPEARNAFNTQMLEDFSRTMMDFRDDPDLWVGIITGTGEEAFCGGTDAKERLPILRKHRGNPDVTPPNPLRGFELFKPLIAAVNGLAMGMGTEIVLACDIRVASEKARFGLTEVTLGLMPGQGGATRLPRMIPWCRAAEMILTGAVIDARKAEHYNLINEVVTPGELMSAARKWGERICKAAPLAVKSAKENMSRSLNMSLSDGLRLESTLVSFLVGSEDFAEGIRAFGEKRKPEYKGK